jgi:hypothetical protein
MASDREEDLSELDGDAVLDKVRELQKDGWKPTSLTLTREKDEKDEQVVLRDEHRG